MSVFARRVKTRWSRALESSRRFLARVARYLGPLLWDAVTYLWRLFLDCIGGLRILYMYLRARRHPERTEAYRDHHTTLHARRAERWRPWRDLTTGRRIAVRTAALAAIAVALAIAWPSRDRPPSATQIAAEPVAAAPPGLSPAIDRMRSDIARASNGDAVFLADGPVVGTGPGDSWSGFRVGAPVVLREDDSRYRLWYRGCRLYGFDHGCAIGQATSTDGLEWTASSEPVLVPLAGSDEFDLGAIAVARANGRYFLWYALWPDWFDKRPTSELYLATSTDGQRWDDHGRVLASEEPIVSVQPSVVHDGQQFHLWFVDSRRHSEDRDELKDSAPFLRHFTSPDGRAWQAQASFPLGPLDHRPGRLSVSREADGSYRAFFLSRRAGGDAESSSVGWLVSSDGSDWRVASTTRVDARSLGTDVEYVSDATAVRIANGALVWFVAAHPGGRQDIRAAFFKESQ